MRGIFIYFFMHKGIFASVISFLACSTCGYSQNTSSSTNQNNLRDSVGIYIEQSKSDAVGATQRLDFLIRAFKFSKKIEIDSIKAQSLSKLSYQFYRHGDSLWFREVNRDAIELSKKIKDSSLIALAYWDLGDFFKRNIF